MKYIILGIIIVVVVIVARMVTLKWKKKTSSEEFVQTENAKCESSVETVILPSQPPVIRLETITHENVPSEKSLIEIPDSKVVAQINNLIPELAQVGNSVNNAAQAVQANGEVLYRVIIPSGTRLADSTAMEGAVRGFYHGAGGINGHANLMAVETQKSGAIVANATAAAMGIASIVVGQYYMSRINTELGMISDSISTIVNFQDNEYRSRVFSLVAHVKMIADFQTEILENNELRLSKVSQLDSLEEECTKLLGQANLTLSGFTKESRLDYDAYERTLRNAQNWFVYQKSLSDVLCKIVDLRFALRLGMVSREQCIAVLPTYLDQVSKTQNELSQWHHNTTSRLQIDTSRNRRRRVGFERAFYSLPGLFDKGFNYRPIKRETANLIATQVSGHNSSVCLDESDLYSQDVQLIIKNGKIYYSPAIEE